MNPGDVVELRSGGPPMTVVSIQLFPETPSKVSVIWFNDDGELCNLALPANVLRIADDVMESVH
jgi:uncharacterized protein YodC (DUF2158 family)